jgi:hypothetical protein
VDRVRSAALALVVAALCLPVVAGARAVADDWVPIGDDAAIGVLAHDVFTGDSPLVGMPTTLGGPEYSGRVHHLGPLEFWALAVPERVAGSRPWGLVAGVALVGVASLAAVAWAATRAAGAATAVPALALVVAMGWSLGRQVLADPWNPYVAVLPLAASLFTTWAVAAGDARVLPAAALAASFAAQAHVVYAPLALALLAAAYVAVVTGRSAVRELLAASAVLAAAWALPVWEQLTGREGNLVELFRAYRDDDSVAVGWRFAARAVARAIGVPPAFARPAADVDGLGAPVSVAVALGAALVVGALAAGTVVAVVRRDRLAAAAGCVALGSLALVTATTAQVPQAFPDVPFYRTLPLWPVATFTWFAGALCVGRLLASRAARRVVVVAAAVVIAALVPAVAFHDSPERDDERVMRAVVALAAEVEDDAAAVDPVRVEAVGEASADVGYGLVRELRRRGVDARVAEGDPYLGRSQAAPAAAPVLLVVGGDAGRRDPAGARLVARYAVATPEDRAAYAAAAAALRARLAATVRGGRGDLAAADAAALAEIAAGRAELDAITRDGTLLRLQAAGRVSLREADVDAVTRWRALRRTVEHLTLAAYLAPAS